MKINKTQAQSIAAALGLLEDISPDDKISMVSDIQWYFNHPFPENSDPVVAILSDFGFDDDFIDEARKIVANATGTEKLAAVNKRGKPPTYKNPSVRLVAQIEVSTLTALDAWRERRGMARSVAVNRLLKAGMSKPEPDGAKAGQPD